MNEKIINSLQNPLVKHLVKLRQESDYRNEQSLLVIEGLKPILEVLPWIKKIFYSDIKFLPQIQAPEIYKVSDAVMKKISGMTSPEGILAEVEMPKYHSLKGKNDILAFDGINDPGNLGTLMRTALALGWEGIFLLPNCCDPYNEKVIRAARGAQFRLSLYKGTIADLKRLILENNLSPYVADLEGMKPEEISKQKRTLLVLGNEAQGASQEIISLCSKVTIPMPGDMESLNVAVAGGILMYVLRDRAQ